jgi:hypothetical protein
MISIAEPGAPEIEPRERGQQAGASRPGASCPVTVDQCWTVA